MTTSTLYLSLLYHRQHRYSQSAILHQSATLLNSIAEPYTPDADALRRQRLHELSAAYRIGGPESHTTLSEAREGLGIFEIAKERWNREVEGIMRWVVRRDWRSDVEKGVEQAERLGKEVGKEAAQGIGEAGVQAGRAGAKIAEGVRDASASARS